MALNDVYEITLNQKQGGQEVSNVFHVQQMEAFAESSPTVAQDLATAFLDEVLPLIQAWQTAEVITESIRARNLFNGADDFTLAVGQAGAGGLTAHTLPQFSALGFRLNGDNPLVRNGAKRFAGLTEDVQDDGVVTNVTFISQIEALATKLEGFIGDGFIMPEEAFKFCIVKRIAEVVGGVTKYRLPASLAEAVISYVVSVVWNALITSQTSRKIGVGS